MSTGSAELVNENEQFEAARQLGCLVDGLLKNVEPKDDTGNKYRLMEKIADINNYLSIYIAFKPTAGFDDGHDAVERALRSITLEKTQDGRAVGTFVYKLENGEAVWCEEDSEGKIVKDAQPVLLDDVASLENLLHYRTSQDQFVA